MRFTKVLKYRSIKKHLIEEVSQGFLKYDIYHIHMQYTKNKDIKIKNFNYFKKGRFFNRFTRFLIHKKNAY
jgi:hypothetical protein